MRHFGEKQFSDGSVSQEWSASKGYPIKLELTFAFPPSSSAKLLFVQDAGCATIVNIGSQDGEHIMSLHFFENSFFFVLINCVGVCSWRKVSCINLRKGSNGCLYHKKPTIIIAGPYCAANANLFRSGVNGKPCMILFAITAPPKTNSKTTALCLAHDPLRFSPSYFPT